jgi:hypothetical protein
MAASYWLKNRAPIGLTISLGISLLLGFAFVVPQQSKVKTIESSESSYLTSEIDFQVPSPSQSQLEGMVQKGLVSTFEPYYLTRASVGTASKSAFIMVDDFAKMNFTMFNSQTKVTEKTVSGTSAWVDRAFLDRSGLSLGSSFNVSIGSTSIPLCIASVYQTNQVFDGGTVVIEYTGSVKDAYVGAVDHVAYSAAFLKAENYSSLEASLSNGYIPEGLLRDRSEFPSDEEYQAYNDKIKNGDYSNQITNFRQKRTAAQSSLASANNNATVFSYIGSGISFLLIVLFSLLLALRPSEKKYFSKKEDRRSVSSYRLISSITEGVAFAIGSAIWVFSLGLSNLPGVSILIPVILIPLVSYPIMFFVSSRIDKKQLNLAKQSGKHQKEE